MALYRVSGSEKHLLKNFLHILAVSMGGGLMLGAGMRLAGQRRESEGDQARSGQARDRVASALRRLETLEKVVPLSDPLDVVGNVETKLKAMELRLRDGLERRQDEKVADLGAELQRRLSDRIESIEAEVAGQRLHVRELHECSLRTEHNLQKVLEGIARLVEAQETFKPAQRSRE